MPRKPTHVMGGFLTGTAASGIGANAVPERHRSQFMLAAALGGIIGGIAPDFLDPPDTPNHRSTFHSLVAIGLLVAAAKANWHAHCLEQAVACETKMERLAIGSPERIDEERKALIWRCVAGFLIGFLAGYASHLALDGTTPRGLPLVFASF